MEKCKIFSFISMSNEATMLEINSFFTTGDKKITRVLQSSASADFIYHEKGQIIKVVETCLTIFYTE